jgi:hypothetical protein
MFFSLMSLSRESFWQKDQSDEKLRIVAERERKAAETRSIDVERKQREEHEGRSEH